jgi:hypothetical protein
LVATGSATIALNDSDTIYFSGVQDETLTGSVTVTLGGSVTDDTDSSNTLTFSNVTNSRDLQMNGETQFGYIDNLERNTKYTVDETVAEIQAMIDGDS